MQYRFRKWCFILLTAVLAVMLLTTAAVASEATFETQTFKGVVLVSTADDVSVKMYKGHSGSTELKPVYTGEAAELDPAYIEGTAYYYEVAAGSKYYYVAKPSSGYARYTLRYNLYITEDEAATRTVIDVTPPKRSTNGWDPATSIYQNTDESNANYPSDASLWPQYAEHFTTPAFQPGRNLHQQTTQTELMNFLNGLDGAEDHMYLYILGKSGGRKESEYFEIPLVVFTHVDLSGAATLEDAAALIRADSEKNGKLTVHYQAELHGDEPAAGEAALGLIKRLDGQYGEGLLDNMNIYLIPRVSPNGAYRSDRMVYITNTTTTNPNGDFLKLQSKEVQLRMRAFNLFEPDIAFDAHEYRNSPESISVKKQDLQMCSLFMPAFTQEFKDTAMDLAYAAFGQLTNDGLAYSWYTDYINGSNAGIGNSNASFRGTLSVLMESQGIDRGLYNLERRVAAHASAMTAMLAYLDENTQTVKNVVRKQREILVETGRTYEEEDVIVLDFEGVKHEEYYIDGWSVNLSHGAVTETVHEAWIAEKVNRSRIAPTAYVIPAGESYTATVLERMDMQGILYEFIPAGSRVNLQQYAVEYDAAGAETGNATLLEETAVTFPEGAYVFTMAQVDREILARLMEPDVTDSPTHTFAGQGVIPAVNGQYPIYRYIRDLNSEDKIDYAAVGEAPEGLETVGATKIGGTGKITGLDATKAYEYRTETAGSYTAVTPGATEIADLPVGKYYVRFAATATTGASADAIISVEYGVLEEYAVYLNSAGGAATNDGYTENTAVNTIDLAYSQLTALMESAPAGTTGKIVIIGTYTLDGERILPEHEYPLLITGGKFIFKETSPAGDYRYLGMGGDTTFDDITISVGQASDLYYLYAQGHKLTFGKGVVCEPFVGSSGSNHYFNVSGGKKGGGTVATTDITIMGGRFTTVYAADYTGKVTDRAQVSLSNCRIYRLAVSYIGITQADVYMELENVTIGKELSCGNRKSNNVEGDVTLTLGENVTAPKNSIFAGSLSGGNVLGTVTVVADGIDLAANPILGKANNTTGTIGGLKLVLNKGELADVAENFVTMDGTEIVLGCDQTKAATLNYSCNLDLNGCDATITVAEGKTLTVWDSSTDDFDVLDKNGNRTYGILNATGNAVAKEGYLVREETTGKSYHRKSLELGGVTLRPAIGGIYYTGQFGLNELCRDNVACYGVVLSIKENPELDKEGCEHSTLTTWPQDGAGHGTVLSGIMKKDGGFTANSRNAATKVYGVAYIKYTDGTVEYSEAASFSLQELVEYSDAMWQGLDQTQKDGLLELYSGFKSVMKFWNIPNIKAAQ